MTIFRSEAQIVELLILLKFGELSIYSSRSFWHLQLPRNPDGGKRLGMFIASRDDRSSPVRVRMSGQMLDPRRSMLRGDASCEVLDVAAVNTLVLILGLFLT